MNLKTNGVRIAVLAAAALGLAILAAWAGWTSVSAARPAAGDWDAVNVVPAVMVSADEPTDTQATAPGVEQQGETVCGACERHRHRHGHHGECEHNCPNCPHDGQGEHRHGHGCANCPYHHGSGVSGSESASTQPSAAHEAQTGSDPVRLASARVVVSATDESAVKRVPVIDADKCAGCGKCVKIAPKVFRLNPRTEKAEVVNPYGAPASVIQKAIEHCPTGALEWSK